MSAAFDNVKKSWLTLVLSFFLTVITVVLTQAMTSSEVNERALNERIDSKASHEYVEQRIGEHEKRDDARYEGIKDMFFITNERLKEIQSDVRSLNTAK